MVVVRLGDAVPGILVAFITLYAGYLNIVDNYLPKGNYVLAVLSIIIMVLMIIVFIKRRCQARNCARGRRFAGLALLFIFFCERKGEQ
ncbi:MAG: hypothetical protein WCW53_11430 [Syntrophales bacterium]